MQVSIDYLAKEKEQDYHLNEFRNTNTIRK